jgi:AAA family ATP:ADP antiporter
MSLVRKLLGVSPDEQRKVFLLFSYFFVVIAIFWIQKPIRTSKFLTAVGPEYLPFVKLGTALLILPIVLFYASAVRRYRRESIVTGCVAVFTVSSLAFAYAFSAGSGAWLNIAYFFYVDIYITVMVALFWSFANDLTPLLQARRIHGVVGAGGILGGLTGSALTGWSVQTIGPAQLLLICAVMVLGVALLARSTMRACRLPMPNIHRGEPALSFRAALDGARMTLKTPYLLAIAVMIGCYEVVSNIVDYQFNTTVAAAFSQEGTLTAFLGKLNSVIMVASLAAQLILTTWVLRRFGPTTGLLLLPIILGLGSLLFLTFPLVAVATLLFSSDGSLNYSVNQTSKEVLYTTVDQEMLYQAKAFIDMFLFRASKGVSALLILASNLWLVPMGWSIQHLGLISLFFIVIWILTAYTIGTWSGARSRASG